MKKIRALLVCILILLTSCTSQNAAKKNPTMAFALHVIDVGQGDSILVSTENVAMLVDCGDTGAYPKIEKHLKKCGISKLDYLVITHPHEDHVGSAAMVIEEFSPKTVFLCKDTSSSFCYEDMLDAIDSSSCIAKIPDIGCKYSFKDLEFTFLSPLEEFNDENDNSLVLRIQYKDTAYLLMGDAQADAENAIAENFPDLQADVIKIGHHGSREGTKPGFINNLQPSLGLISVGKGNAYSHPHDEVTEILKNAGVTVKRTDIDGDITVESDGKDIYCDGVKIDKNVIKHETVYIGNKKSKKLHTEYCGGLPNEKNSIVFKSREEAIALGYEPCQNCKP